MKFHAETEHVTLTSLLKRQIFLAGLGWLLLQPALRLSIRPEQIILTDKRRNNRIQGVIEGYRADGLYGFMFT